MPIARVWIEEGCITRGMSELNCPELFKIDQALGTSTVLDGADFAPIEEKIKQAAEGCPVEVIKYEES